VNQQTIFKMNLGIFRHISRNVEVRKNPKYFLERHQHICRAENIFPKYLFYNVHEIARKNPREKKRYSSFSDSDERLVQVV
jgi:hypothetical protein